MGACVAVALSGIALWQFWTALGPSRRGLEFHVHRRYDTC